MQNLDGSHSLISPGTPSGRGSPAPPPPGLPAALEGGVSREGKGTCMPWTGGSSSGASSGPPQARTGGGLTSELRPGTWELTYGPHSMVVAPGATWLLGPWVVQSGAATSGPARRLLGQDAPEFRALHCVEPRAAAHTLVPPSVSASSSSYMQYWSHRSWSHRHSQCAWHLPGTRVRGCKGHVR